MSPNTTEATPRRFDLWGLSGGLLLGIFDWGALALIGVDMRIGGHDVALLVASFFTITYAVLGFVIGRLAMARRRAQRDAATIARQLDELEISERAAAQHEKLAALGRVAAGIAHEVRNPLGVIRASASMIEDGLQADDDAIKACRFITEEIDRLDALIDSLLRFARPSALRLRAIEVSSVVERAVQLAADETRRRGIEVDLIVEPELPPVTADPDLVAQVVFGLLVNAAEAIESAGHAAITVRRSDTAIAIEVADSGPGIDSGDAALIFEPFYTTKARGTGLGLAVTARIIERHGGRIEALPGRGTGPSGSGACFRIELPVGGPSTMEEGA